MKRISLLIKKHITRWDLQIIKKIKHFVSRWEGKTLVLRIIGGIDEKSKIIFDFLNDHCSYLINRVLYNLKCVSNQSGQSVLIDRKVFNYSCESQKKLVQIINVVQNIWDCSGHQFKPETAASLAEIKEEFRKIHRSATYLIQPLDPCIIMIIKMDCRNLEGKKLQTQLENPFSDAHRSSGFFLNLEISYFLD